MSLQHQDRLWAYIQLPSTAPTQSVNTGLYRLLQPLDELIVPILGQAYVRYPSVGLGTCPQSIITDHYAPYCDELEYAVSNDIRMLAVTQRRDGAPTRTRTVDLLITNQLIYCFIIILNDPI